MRKTIVLAILTVGLAVSAILTDLVRAYAAETSISPDNYVQSIATWLAR